MCVAILPYTHVARLEFCLHTYRVVSICCVHIQHRGRPSLVFSGIYFYGSLQLYSKNDGRFTWHYSTPHHVSHCILITSLLSSEAVRSRYWTSFMAFWVRQDHAFCPALLTSRSFVFLPSFETQQPRSRPSHYHH